MIGSYKNQPYTLSMPKTTAFHSRLAPFNETGIWKNWSGYLVAANYQYSIASEYYAIRNSVSLLDTSPLFKYEFRGSDVRNLLEIALARDIRKCRPGQAQYTVWCDQNGFVVQDGVIVSLAEDHFFLTAAEPALRYFRQIARKASLNNLQVNDVSSDYGILALQGPHALDVLNGLPVDVAELGYFDATKTEIAGAEVIITRTGFTGDLGYELWIRAEDAELVWDRIIRSGSNYNITPIGTTPLKMARVEAGLLLMGVDFLSSKFSWVDAQRESPVELGWQWMFRNLDLDDRDFIGRKAIESEVKNGTSRWRTVGLEIDWQAYQDAFLNAGIAPPMHELYLEQTMSIYRISNQPYEYLGYASSFLFSSLLKKPIAIAKLPIESAKPGTEVEIEISVIRKPVNVLARVTKLPFFNPSRRTAMFDRANAAETSK